MAGVEQKIVDTGEAGMRLDRWFKVHYPGLGFGHLQKLLRSGQVRIDGSRAKADTRIQAGQTVRIPPLGVDEKAVGPVTARTIRSQQDGDVLSQMLLYEDPKVYVFNKPAGLAVQGGSGVSRHVDGMLEAWRNKKGEKPRLVHRIDRDTSGVLVVARTRGAAQALNATPKRPIGLWSKAFHASAKTKFPPGWSGNRHRMATRCVFASMVSRIPITLSHIIASLRRQGTI